MRATVADGVGPAVAPDLVGAWDRIRIYKPWRELLVELISLLPSDEAFKLLLERYEREFVREYLLAAMERFPVRAVRVLTAPGRAPRLPAYADPEVLPQVLLKGEGRALPAAATRRPTPRGRWILRCSLRGPNTAMLIRPVAQELEEDLVRSQLRGLPLCHIHPLPTQRLRGLPFLLWTMAELHSTTERVFPPGPVLRASMAKPSS
ncbi:hypothetical protein AB0L65_35975 [Nonomuraea sp. NPDC052116]|uniref:hypothetical protein n=1 Tax=Nonomuraea sp. NPDC052116 TaxID=3155665 RepID=UPI003413BD5B